MTVSVDRRRRYLDGWADALERLSREHDAALERARLSAAESSLRPDPNPGALAAAAVQVLVDDALAGRDVDAFAMFVVDTNPTAAAILIVDLVDALIVRATGTLPILDRAIAAAAADGT